MRFAGAHEFLDLREVADKKPQKGQSENEAEAALRALLAGPTKEERAAGYRSSFSAATAGSLLSLDVEGDAAYLNFTDLRPLIPSASASAGSAAFRSEVEATLRHALPITRVIYAIGGDPAVFYEWQQEGCTAANDFCDRPPFCTG